MREMQGKREGRFLKSSDPPRITPDQRISQWPFFHSQSLPT